MDLPASLGLSHSPSCEYTVCVFTIYYGLGIVACQKGRYSYFAPCCSAFKRDR